MIDLLPLIITEAVLELLRRIGLGGTTALGLALIGIPFLYGRKALGIGSIFSEWVMRVVVAAAIIGALLVAGVLEGVDLATASELVGNTVSFAGEYLSDAFGEK